MGEFRGVHVDLDWLLDVLPIDTRVAQLVGDEVFVRAANPASFAVTGYRAERVLDRPLRAYQPDELADRIADIIREALDAGEPTELDVTAEVPTGTRTYRIRFAPLPALGDDFVLATTLDRTEEVRAIRALEETQQLARLGHWTWDPASDVIVWTPQLYELFGISPDQFEADFDTYVDLVHPDDREMIKSEVARVMREGGGYHFRHRLIRPDGDERTLESYGEVVLGSDGEVLRLHGTAQDVTDQVRLEEEALKLREAGRRYAEGLDLNDNVVQGLAAARLALMVGDTDEAQAAIDRTIDAAREIVRGLLETRLERSGKLEPGDLVRSRGALEEAP